MKNERLLSLDLVRSSAVILIILFHYNHSIRVFISDSLTFFDMNGFSGTIGVTLFLLLSGASLISSNRDKFTAIKFYEKRFWSIFPLFYVSYIAMVFFITFVFIRLPFSYHHPLSIFLTIIGMDGYLLYKFDNYYLIGEWFLGLIIIYYLIFPVIRYFYIKNKHLTVLTVVVIGLISYYFYNFDMNALRFPTIRLFEFVAGMYIISFLRQKSFIRDWSLLVISLSAIILFFARYTAGSPLITGILPGILVFIFIISLSNLQSHSYCKNAISFISKYSFGAFLFHHQFIDDFVLSFREYIDSKLVSFLALIFVLFVSFSASYILTNLTIRLVSKIRKQPKPVPAPLFKT